MNLLQTQTLESARLIASAPEDEPRESAALKLLADIHYRQGNWRDAAALLQAVMQGFTDAGDERSRASTLTLLGETYRHLHEYETAIELLRCALEIHERHEDRHSAAMALASIGNVQDEIGRKPESSEAFRLASQFFLESGDRRNAAAMMGRRSEVLHGQSLREEAIEYASAALCIFQELDEPAAEHLLQRIAVWLLDAVVQPASDFTHSAFNFETVTLNKRARVVKRVTGAASQYRQKLAPGVALEMVEIPGGIFSMGSPAEEERSLDAERPRHEVAISSFHIGKFAVTQAQWRVVAGWPKVERALCPEPSRFNGGDRPVECVSWFDAAEFCARLTRATDRPWRLPTEAEWEYACRAGTSTPFAFGETIAHEIVNYYSEYPFAMAPTQKPRCMTAAVGSLGAANAFGLYDMHGNTREWCLDWYGQYSSESQTDPAGPRTGSSRVLRGGAWHVNAYGCRSADRHAHPPHLASDAIGFRVVVSSIECSRSGQACDKFAPQSDLPV